MNLTNFENLIKTGQLNKEPMNKQECIGLLHSGQTRFHDATKPDLAEESSFDLAYNAAHALSLAALRWHGYRAKNRYIVFLLLPYTLEVGPEVWRILSKCHECRNLAEYEGHLDVDSQLLKELIFSTSIILDRATTLILSK